jgi:hypothetical protein
MRKTRHLIAVTLVATALCADRLAVATPTAPPVAQLAGRLIQRLSGGFRQQLPSQRLYQPFRTSQRPMSLRPLASPEPILALSLKISPFHFSLPPPAL